MEILVSRGYSSPTSLLQILEIFPGNRQSSLRGPAPLCQLRSDKLVTCFTRKTRSYFRFAPPPYPRDKTVSNNSPPPGPKGWTCPGGCPGGMVTGKIEPCINFLLLPANIQYLKGAVLTLCVICVTRDSLYFV